MAEQDRKAAMQTAGLSEQLDRIEAKLDALLEALADEQDEPETAEVVTMDGDRVPIQSGGDWL